MAFLAAALATIVAGLAVHLRGAFLGPAARDVAGDALWAMMITWWVSALAPHSRWAIRALVSWLTCAAVEMSQLLHTPALDAIRATRAGRLVLGSGFDPRDLVAYAGGVAIAAMIGAWVQRRAAKRDRALT